VPEHLLEDRTPGMAPPRPLVVDIGAALLRIRDRADLPAVESKVLKTLPGQQVSVFQPRVEIGIVSRPASVGGKNTTLLDKAMRGPSASRSYSSRSVWSKTP